jgi:2-methylisocitrate lyase-like PEP mutase family enzyme
VTADLEDGYGLSAEEFVERLVAAGACGANLEDSDYRAGGLVAADRHAERIAAIKAVARARGFNPVINARVARTACRSYGSCARIPCCRSSCSPASKTKRTA